ncbi:MAG: ribulose-phosphate 3-epimerase [Lachnospiraceae bacterium]|nr:ribulose-phosphate 3-epimerase [Lachnospiraceae bacterium]
MMPVLINPSILGADLLHLSDELRALKEGGADYIHFDVMDGRFVPEISFGELLLREVRAFSDIPTDVHLMVTESERHLDSFIRAGASRITVHVEAAEDLSGILDTLEQAGVLSGISVNPETPVVSVFPYLDRVDSILVMTVHPGFGGQHFMEESLPRIRTLREEIVRKGSRTRIAVDGGINTETALLARKAGADTFVSGTFVFRNGPETVIRKLRELLEDPQVE